MSWYAANDRYLEASLARVRRLLERHAGGEKAVDSDAGTPVESFEIDGHPPALEALAATFGLSAFERDVLLLAAGPDLGADFPARPTFALALAALDEPYWGALSPQGSLRQWRLVELGEGGLSAAPLRADERVLHYLHGLEVLDERLAGIVEPLPVPRTLVPSQARVVERLAGAWARAAEDATRLPVAELSGLEMEGKREIAAAAARALGLSLLDLQAAALPTAPAELDGLVRLLGREAALTRAALLLDAQELDAADAARDAALTRFVDAFRGVLVVAVRERRRLGRRTVLPLDVEKPTAAEQAALWRAALGSAAPSLNGQVETLTTQFDLSAAAIRSAAAEVLGQGEEMELAAVWDACLRHARPRLEALAQRIRPAATWDDLVLPEPQRQILAQIAVHVRRRARVYDDWGFAARSSRGLGVSALFSGPSGTGKTMAAEVLAGELGLDLFRIDLSSVVSKYIGETEKNLRKVFDAAEEGGAILLFDEADALFGKRSEVKDSHDRYANIEVGYLLQRMEAYRGLAILTTNLKDSLDPAFLRRLRFVVQFPFPEAAQREEIWRRVFPKETPVEGLEPKLLARLGVAGGNIRNIALNAAFLAADEGEPVRMGHLLRAARSEYAKIEKPLTTAEIGDWEP
ncbi:MAG TPA: ATP-binding protein [Thermoanaerobaculia bacterium]|nr:ATP-binding protein [Thermoanaerobaculia bacterium]